MSSTADTPFLILQINHWLIVQCTPGLTCFLLITEAPCACVLLSSGQLVSADGEPVLDEAEVTLLIKLRGAKDQYRQNYEELLSTKAEVQYCRHLVDQCRMRLLTGNLLTIYNRAMVTLHGSVVNESKTLIRSPRSKVLSIWNSDVYTSISHFLKHIWHSVETYHISVSYSMWYSCTDTAFGICARVWELVQRVLPATRWGSIHL